MPYKETKDLPRAVRKYLPHHGQRIFRAVWNAAFEHYGQDEKTAFRVAWAAVKRCYEKSRATEDTGRWIGRKKR